MNIMDRSDKIFDVAKFMVETKYEDLPKGSIEAAKFLFLDTLATTIAGSTATICPEVVNLYSDWGGKPESSVLVYGNKLPAPYAAFLNGTMAHARDYDDNHEGASMHCAVSVLPACLAAGEAFKASGKDFLAAFVKGVEMIARLALGCTDSITVSGWIYSALCGYFPAAGCASALMGLDVDQTAMAMGIALSQVGGTHQAATDVPLTKRMQPGFASSVGVNSAYMARAGVIGCHRVLEGKYGFYPLYLRGNYDIDRVVKDLGKTPVYEIEKLAYKPYPCCRFTHSTIDAARMLTKQHNIKPEEVTGIDVQATYMMWHDVCDPIEMRGDPQTLVTAQFSIPYTCATAIVTGSVTLDDMTDEALWRPEVRRLAKLVTASVNEELNKKYDRSNAPTILTIKTTRGDFTGSVPYTKGSPENPFTKEDLSEKIENCKRYSAFPVNDAKFQKALDMIDHMEDLDDITVLIDAIQDSFERG